MSKQCRYGCGSELGQFDTKQNKFLESDQKTVHTRDRCQELKSKKAVDDWANEKQETNGHNGNDLSLEIVLKKLKSIGITLDLTVLRNAVNGDNKLMTRKIFCSCCNELIHIECTDEFCDTCHDKIKDGEIEGYDF